MRAAVLAGPLRAPIVRLQDVEAPAAPEGRELLVQVLASSINGTDLGFTGGGLPFVRVKRGPFVLGFDVVGDVIASGPEVDGFEVGDRIVALIDHGGGGQAEQVLVPEQRCALAPRSIPVEQAGALPLAGLTALQALRGGAHLHVLPSPRVLVVGAAGGIGSFGVLLAKDLDAHVTALASGDRAEYLRGLGADEVVQGRTDDLDGTGERWDVVLDSPAVLDLDAARPLLTPHGVLVSTKPLSPDVLKGLVQRDGPRFVGVRTQADRGLTHLVRLVEEGRLQVPLDSTYRLDEVEAAYAHAGSSGSVQGKVALVV